MSETIDAIFGRHNDWLFWPPSRPVPGSAWLEHIPFAHWLIGAARPRLLVELGTHRGASYAAFCDAVRRNGLDTRCYAVDTWEGDKHSGSYGEEIHAELASFNAEHFAGYSTLLRMTFDDAVSRFSNGSVDLLHIDGLHTYEAVKHDFESWVPMLSDRAIVLFHDTAERSGDFGVWKFWDEVKTRYPHFEFEHEHGLGVLLVGSKYDGAALPLFQAKEAADIETIRSRFEALGDNVTVRAYAAQTHRELERLRRQVGTRPKG